MTGKTKYYEYYWDSTPALVSPPLEPFGKPVEEYWGACVPFQINSSRGIRGRYLIPRDETLAAGKHMVTRFLKENDLFGRAVSDFDSAFTRLKGIFWEIEKISLKGVGNMQLYQLEHRLNDAYAFCYVPGYLVEPSYFYLEHAVRERLGALLEQKGLVKEYSRYFVELTPIAGEPVHVTEDKDLLEILALVEKEQDAVKLLSGGKFDSESLARFSEIHGRLAAHARRFFWVNNGYAQTQCLDESYFAGQLAEKLASNVSARAKLKEYGEKERQRQIARDNAARDLELPAELKALLDLVGKVAYFQDYRKTAMLQAVHFSSTLIREMARRTGIPFHDLLYALPRELDEKTLSSQEFRKILHGRSKRCLAVYGYDNWEIYCGDEAERREHELLGKGEEASSTDSSIVMGLCASVGYAVGPARIVLSALDVGKVQKGDVLVAPSTRPEYVPAMRKACAIVTDEGGITSHAAIVSRELGIPCVIATKVGTKVFKDGDLLEVRANHGVVNKLEG